MKKHQFLTALIVGVLCAGALGGWISRTTVWACGRGACPCPPTPTDQEIRAWVPNTAYPVGLLVMYNGQVYRCLQNHISRASWPPPRAPFLWQRCPGRTPPARTPTATATATPTRSPTSTPTPTPEPTLVWPTLLSLSPNPAVPGETVHIIASGGYIRIGNMYDESFRTFALYFDGVAVDILSCYAGGCQGDLTVPTDASVGTHIVSTEGGSQLELQVVSAY